MSEASLKLLSDRLSSAHQKIQAEHETINPVIGVNRQMRTAGIPADAFTIDCLQTGRRVLMILHDQEPDIVRYQFGMKDEDPGATFEIISVQEASEQVLIDWIVGYFRDGSTG